MKKEQLIDLDNKQVKLLKEILSRHIPNTTVWAYGSRVKWKAQKTSDLDLVIFDCNAADDLKEAFEESGLSISVDVLSWDSIPDDFKENIKKKYAVLQEKQKLEGWREMELGEVAKLSKIPWKVGDKSLPYIALEHFVEGGLRLNGIGNSNEVESNKWRFSHKDFLFGKLRPYFRKLYRPNFDGICSTDIWVVSPIEGNDKNFLFYLFANRQFIELSYSGSSGTRMPRADWGFVKETKWNIPSLPEQKAISEVLSSLDDKIDLLHRQNKTLEDMAQTLFRQWFVEEADEGWEERKFSDFFDFLEGPGIRNWQYTEKGTRFINIRLMQDREINIEKSNFVSDEEANGKYEHFLLKEKDMIISTSGTLGKTAIIRGYHLPLLLNTSVIRFRPRDRENYSFMYQHLKSRYFQENLFAFADGSVQKNFGPTHLRQIKFKLPPKQLIEKFEQTAKPINDKVNESCYQIRKLEHMRDALLPKLMSGDVRVKQ